MLQFTRQIACGDQAAIHGVRNKANTKKPHAAKYGRRIMLNLITLGCVLVSMDILLSDELK
jgi:hypothetical protein